MVPFERIALLIKPVIWAKHYFAFEVLHFDVAGQGAY